MLRGRHHVPLFEVDWESVLGTHSSFKCTAMGVTQLFCSQFWELGASVPGSLLWRPHVFVFGSWQWLSPSAPSAHSASRTAHKDRCPEAVGFHRSHCVPNKSGCRIWWEEGGEFPFAPKNPFLSTPDKSLSWPCLSTVASRHSLSWLRLSWADGLFSHLSPSSKSREVFLCCTRLPCLVSHWAVFMVPGQTFNY